MLWMLWCDWGEMGCLQEATPLLYGSKEQDAINSRKMNWWVAGNLFFVHDKSGTTNSPWCITKMTLTILKQESYLVGKLANVIRGEDWDEYFFNNLTKMSFAKVIHDMYKVNPNVRKIV
jgi:hypothetical protein